MTRPDLKTLAWLAPLATVLSVWWIWSSSPCMDNQLEAQWRRWFPLPPMPPSTSPVAVATENPYGIVACDFWPEAHHHVISLLVLTAIVTLIGFLAARRFQERPVKRAAWILLGATTAAMTLSGVAFLPDLIGDGSSSYWNRIAAIEVAVSLALVALSSLLGALAAWLTLKWRARG